MNGTRNADGYGGYEIGLGFKCVEGSPGIGGNRISVPVSRQTDSSSVSVRASSSRLTDLPQWIGINYFLAYLTRSI